MVVSPNSYSFVVLMVVVRLDGDGGGDRVKAMVEECREYIALENAPIVPISATGNVLVW